MHAIPLTAILVMTPLLALAQAGGRADQEVIQGTWKWTSGEAVTVFDTPSPSLRFSDTKALVINATGDTEKTGRFEVFQGANPPELVFTLLDVTKSRKWERKAAYEVTDKSLKLCFHAQPMVATTCRTAAVIVDFHR